MNVMQKGRIDVTTENIFPIIKKFLYSEHEIFLRELISNAVDATQKLKTLASHGDFKGELGDLTIRVYLDKKKKTLTVSDRGIGMTEEEVAKYINQIAFSSAEEFLAKYQNQESGLIGHFGLGFYSSFMVSDKVEIITRSYQDDVKAIKWICDGSPEYTIEDAERQERGTDVILHLDKDSKEFLEDSKIESILKKYCRFLPIEIAFGKEKEWKDGKEVETGKDHIINETKPLWTRKPVDVKDEDYAKFYSDLYPMQDAPLFNIHLNVDYPFNLTGILYFPRIKSNIEIQKNKIQLYCNQVYVTDSVEGIVPEFLTLLHGVLDSPDIPLNVSRSYLQGDPNVKKISAHITKKVADRLEEIFKKDRSEFEKKWDDLKLFIEFGMLTEEKFYERAEKFALLKNTDGKYFTLEEYANIIKENQTDKNKNLIYLYATDKEAQYSYIEKAKNKGYDVLLMNGQLDTHFLNHLEQKLKDSRFTRVDADVVEKLIMKDESTESNLTDKQKEDLRPVFESQLPEKEKYYITYENLSETEYPIIITQPEYMRRMKDMSELSAGMNFYAGLPESYNMVINTNHPLVIKVNEAREKSTGKKVEEIESQFKPVEEEISKLQEKKKDKKDEEVSTEDKDKLESLNKQLDELKGQKSEVLREFGKKNKIVRQLIDLALLSNNMLKGEDMIRFVNRSIDLIK
jgi:molecular chaperone HtpG